jgi:hypothetical protein
LKYLTRTDRLRIIRSLRRLEKLTPEACAGRTAGDWLRDEGHSPDACRRFWAVVLTSALSETLERASLAAARKVFVDGFFQSKDAYQLWVPNEPLGTLFDQPVGTWLENRGVTIHRNSPVRRLVVENQTARALETADGRLHSFDQILAAIPSHRFLRLLEASEIKGTDSFFPKRCLSPLSESREENEKKQTTEKAAEKGTGTFCSKTSQSPFPLEHVPITAIHLWFDRPVSTLPHAVLVDQRGNWMFRPPWAEPTYAQLVVSESRSMLGLTRSERDAIVRQLADELIQTVADKSQPAPQLLRHHTITHPRAVFSVTPDSDEYRPDSKALSPQIQNLHLAGDWTATGWPATIEGAIRSF